MPDAYFTAPAPCSYAKFLARLHNNIPNNAFWGETGCF